MIIKYQSVDDYEAIIEHSRQRPVFLFKHSTVCSISAMAWRQFTLFAEKTEEPEYWQVLVREDRPLSLDIAERSGVVHQSPQVILFSDGRPVWNCSHHNITINALQKALGAYAK